jgi:hypothetical protein
VDRRLITVGLGILTTAAATFLNIDSYQSFLTLVGSVFVPLLGVLAVDFFCFHGRDWDTSAQAPARWGMLVPWLAGIAVYQLIDPGAVYGWSSFWTDAQDWLHFAPQAWMSASLLSFLAAAGITTVIDLAFRGRSAAREGTVTA